MSTVANTTVNPTVKYMPLFAAEPEQPAPHDPALFGTGMTGRRHLFEGLNCQDRWCAEKIGADTVVLAVADGCSGAEQPELAAEVNLAVVRTVAAQRRFWDMPEKKFKQSIARLFEERLRETGYPLDELCATLAFVIINQKTGECICFSVGDSSVSSFDSALNFRPVTYAMNGMDSSYTVFTNYRRYVEKYSYYARRKLSAGVAGFLLMTDGADQLAYGTYYDAQQLLSGLILGSGDISEAMAQHISEVNADDISFCGCYLPSERITSAAKSLYTGQIAPAPQPENPEAGRTKKQFVPAEQPAPAETAAESPAPSQPAETSPEAAGRTKRFTPAPKQAPAAGNIPAPAGKTKPFTPAPVPKAGKPQVPAAPAPKSGLLAYLAEPRTAGEIIGAGLGFDRANFFTEILVLLRTGLVTCSTEGGRTTFRAA